MSKQMVYRINREARANLAHALMHMEANKIGDPTSYSGWYCGNKEQFIKRHQKAIAFLSAILTPSKEPT